MSAIADETTELLQLTLRRPHELQRFGVQGAASDFGPKGGT